MTDVLRVLYLGSQPPLRSQTLWHAVAYGVSDGEPPTLSFVRPGGRYVSIGYHRRLDELDGDACRREGLPVFRRMIGGGPVYLDPDQLFFQIVVPMGMIGRTGAHAIRRLLAPAVEAYRDAGIDATFDDHGDISVGEAKISGIGGGQIEGAAVAVGNLIESFDHEAMGRVLALDPDVRDEAVRLMRRFVVPTPADPEMFMSALVRRYAAAFDLKPRPGELSEGEEEALVELDERFVSPEWLEGPARPEPAARQVKIRAGVWVFSAEHEGARVTGSVVDDVLARIRVSDPDANGAGSAIEAALVGAKLSEVGGIAGGFGDVGTRVAGAIARCDGRTL